jgi:hypothetical protein
VGELAPRVVPDHLGAAAAAAAGLPDLAGRAAEALDAKAAAIVAADGAVSPADLAATLGVARTTVWRLADRAPPPALVRAIRLQCDVRARLAAELAPERPYAAGG